MNTATPNDPDESQGEPQWIQRPGVARCRWVHWGGRVLSGLLGSLRCALRIVGYFKGIALRPGGCRVLSEPQDSLVCALRVVDFAGVRPAGRFMVAELIGMCPGGRQVLSVWLGSSGCAQGDVGFVRGHRVHCGSPCGSSGSFGVTGFIGVDPGGRRVRSVSLGTFGNALGVVGFVRGRSVHWVTPCGSSGSFGVAGFSPGCLRFVLDC